MILTILLTILLTSLLCSVVAIVSTRYLRRHLSALRGNLDHSVRLKALRAKRDATPLCIVYDKSNPLDPVPVLITMGNFLFCAQERIDSPGVVSISGRPQFSVMAHTAQYLLDRYDEEARAYTEALKELRRSTHG